MIPKACIWNVHCQLSGNKIITLVSNETSLSYIPPATNIMYHVNSLYIKLYSNININNWMHIKEKDDFQIPWIDLHENRIIFYEMRFGEEPCKCLHYRLKHSGIYWFSNCPVIEDIFPHSVADSCRHIRTTVMTCRKRRFIAAWHGFLVFRVPSPSQHAEVFEELDLLFDKFLTLCFKSGLWLHWTPHMRAETRTNWQLDWIRLVKHGIAGIARRSSPLSGLKSAECV